MKKLIFLLLLMGCTPMKQIHGVYGVTNLEITEYDGEWDVQFYVHVGKDVDYYTIYYYVDDELKYQSRKETVRTHAQQTVGYLDGITINEPATVKALIRSSIGDTYQITDTLTFKFNVP